MEVSHTYPIVSLVNIPSPSSFLPISIQNDESMERYLSLVIFLNRRQAVSSRKTGRSHTLEGGVEVESGPSSARRDGFDAIGDTVGAPVGIASVSGPGRALSTTQMAAWQEAFSKDERQDDMDERSGSRTHTTFSSPCDVDMDEVRAVVNDGRTVVVDDADLNEGQGGSYQRLSTPTSCRSAGFIQIESTYVAGDEGDDFTPQSVMRYPAAGQHLQRRRGAKTRQRLWIDYALKFLGMVGPPAAVVITLHYSVAYELLFVLYVMVALAAWELSWWNLRIRQRLLVPFKAATMQRRVSRESLEQTQFEEMETKQCALSPCLDRWSCAKSKYLVASAASVLITGAIVAVVMSFQDSILTGSKSGLGRRMLLGAATTSSFSGIFCVCLSPTLTDGFVVFVYQACFAVSSLNSFLAHHEHLINDPELLDALYVMLVGACVVVVWRIVSSKEVLASLVMTTLDILGLAYLVAPMMAMSDVLGHPYVSNHSDLVGTFFVVVSAAEAGYHLHAFLKTRFPKLFMRWRHPLAKSVSTTLELESLLFSIIMAIVSAAIVMWCYQGYVLTVTDSFVLLGSICLSQICRVGLEAMQSMARVRPTDLIKQRMWIPGVIELLNPYLVATIVFHPYVKSVIS